MNPTEAKPWYDSDTLQYTVVTVGEHIYNAFWNVARTELY